MILKTIRYFLKVTPLIALVLVCLQFLVSNELAGFGRTVQNTDTKIADLREENQALSQKVASSSSLSTIAAKAGEMGLKATTNYIVIGPEQFAFQANH